MITYSEIEVSVWYNVHVFRELRYYIVTGGNIGKNRYTVLQWFITTIQEIFYAIHDDNKEFVYANDSKCEDK